MTSFRRRELAYKNTTTNAYALRWESCTKVMKNKIKARSELTAKMEKNPIKLHEAIKEHAINYQDNQYDISIFDRSF